VLLVVLGVRQDGQKVLLAVKNMGGETSQAWRAVLDDLVKRELRQPEFLIVDGGTGLEQALAALWSDVPTQRCTVHKHRNLLAHAPPRLHDEVSVDYNDMIYAASPAEIEQRRRAFLRKWRLKCRAVADSLEEAGDRLFTFTRLPMEERSHHQRDRNGCSAAGRRKSEQRTSLPPICALCPYLSLETDPRHLVLPETPSWSGRRA
jgi:transposase-like protein